MVSVDPLKGHAGDQRVGIEGEGFAVARFPAVRAYAKINAAGEWIDRSETVSLNDIFDRMSTQELEAYAQKVRCLSGSKRLRVQTRTLGSLTGSLHQNRLPEPVSSLGGIYSPDDGIRADGNLV